MIATGGTARLAGRRRRCRSSAVNKVAEGRPHIVDRIIDGEIALIFNTTEGWQSLKDSQSIRAVGAGSARCPISPRRRPRDAAVKAIAALRRAPLEVRRCRPIMLTNPSSLDPLRNSMRPLHSSRNRLVLLPTGSGAYGGKPAGLPAVG